MNNSCPQLLLVKFFVLYTACLLAALGLFATQVRADDIEIYNSSALTGLAPNVLFIIDFSGSMNKTPEGDNPSAANPSKVDILRDTLTRVLNHGFSNLNVGLSWFTDRASGIRWPVTGINDDAHVIDNRIPIGKFSVGQVIQRMLETLNPNGETATVDALYEAALYFRGDEVWAGAHAPPKWNIAERQYKGESLWAANPASYGQKNIWKKQVISYDAQTKMCYDYTASGGSNGCANKQDVMNCEFEPAVEGVWDGCRLKKNCPCKIWDITRSECLGYYNAIPPCQCKGGWNIAPHVDRYRCDYTYPGGIYTQGKWTEAEYISPITQSCQPSFIVLVSDGAPSKRSAGYQIEDLVGINSCQDLSSSVFNEAAGTYTYGNCGPELLQYLRKNNPIAGISGSTVSTYTIGFGLNGPGGTESRAYLTKLAKAGGGKFYMASDHDKLVAILSEIIGDIAANNEGLSALVTRADSSTQSTYDKVYLNIFKPSNKRSWIGNTKGYFLGTAGLKDVDDYSATVPDPDGVGVRFKDTARSFWSTVVDGNKVDKGGIVGRLNPPMRNIYTYTQVTAPNNVYLTLSENALTLDNYLITKTHLGLPSTATAADREAVIEWARSAHMNDPLHSRPIEVNYGAMQVLYTMTNAGFLHAIDATHPTGTGDISGGDELFAFIPQGLLGNLAVLSQERSAGDHIYGLDGSLTVWRDDRDKNGVINNGDHVYLYFGMRRGGRHYYALDVTDPNAPILKWRIDGGSADFPNLGQTWSGLVLTTITYQNTDRKVLLFGGGYAAEQDGKTDRSDDSVGNAIYIVDAATGALLWSAGRDGTASATHSVLPELRYSIPADLRAINTDSRAASDHTDRLYFGDLGGQIWRIDLGANLGADVSAAVGYRLADLGGAGGNNRRFFYPPTVALIRYLGEKYFSVAVGSGNRAHPLNTVVNDQFYMIKDPNVANGAPSSIPALIPHSDLYDASANIIGTGDTAAQSTALEALQGAKGWSIDLPNEGEKVLAKALALGHQVMFTTYTPIFNQMKSQCMPPSANGRFYLINLGDATPVRNYYTQDGSTEAQLYVEDRAKLIEYRGIPAEPQLIFTEADDEVCINVNRQCVDTIRQSLRHTVRKSIY